MSDYTVMVLGWKINEWKESMYSVHSLGYNTYLSFNKKNNIKVLYYDKDCKDLPLVDFIIMIVYFDDAINQMDIKFIKEKTNCKKLVTLREVHFGQADFSFVFNSSETIYKNTMYLPPPCNKNLLSPTIKEKKSILIDHYWEDYLYTNNDWTYRIEDWVEELGSEYKVYRLIRFPNEKNNIREFETPIYYDNYLSYLNNTSHIENFIVTHKEGFPYGIIDFAARGARVLVPDNRFIPECMVESFEIPLFKNKEEFNSIITVELNEKWNKKIDNCIDFDNIIDVIDNKFRSWL